MIVADLIAVDNVMQILRLIETEIKDTMWIPWWPICVSLKSDQARILCDTGISH